MSDARNVAHDKKVTQEKHHKNTEAAPGAKRPSRGKKMTAGEKEKKPGESAQAQEAPKAEQGPNLLEKSVAILSKLKEMEFHSRGNIETLAQLTLTIEEELKQGEFSEANRLYLLRAGCVSLEDRGTHRDLLSEVRRVEGADVKGN